ncbi:LEAF RUST 10 DISEASE-RESISTANCE LOCUS RECEPTOR-LIKE PROTEIN KINASE-like 1.2 isoform X2 [Senna tora]|uniref:non-specific serine/threonine protein kinase n=1 Tax=Senna tora TaxID=362788 RepID=A0A834TF40_9FABA|nr:LEAF RUST 10 DISEASE-RESISTANCE LOCUS RECEPTOR-LIKE PROTEIN KINASE-like 1.2 isoform X2 [Senna tora]
MFITIIILLHLANLILCINPKFEACAPQSCDGYGPIIKYPFWIPHKQSAFCGRPHFEIFCNHKKPILKVSNQDFVVQSISNSNLSIVVTNKLAVYQGKCPDPMYYSSIIKTPFIYSSENSNMSFFYNCTRKPKDYPNYEVGCVKDTTHHSFAVFHKEALVGYKNYIHKCQLVIDVPVHVHGISNFTSLMRMNYTEVLKMGFILKWTSPPEENDHCQLCEKSGGRCGGFDNYKFLCFCKDKTHLKSCGDGVSVRNKVIVGVSVFAFTVIVMSIGFGLYKRRQTKRSYAKSYITQSSSYTTSYDSSVVQIDEHGSKYLGAHVFTYSELEEATNHFDASKELGDGGFGTVYYGKLLDGRCVAVKRLYENNYKRVEQFQNEVAILTRLRHQNLVALYGCTSRHSRELLLVYEYIPNGTVADHLHGPRAASPTPLPWNIRLNIAIETASALAYLHASDIIHRDVKTNNILLDDHFCVKVADFGLSRLFPNDVTHISTAPQGTPGYVDPEYHECYQLTDKSDVYSFGVVLIELLSSMPAVDITRHRHEINLATMAINKIHSRKLEELVDPRLGFERDYKVRKEVSAVGELAFQCLQSVKDMRPCMREVVEVLRDIESDGKSKRIVAEVMDICEDDVVLLKNNDDLPPPEASPDSNVRSARLTSKIESELPRLARLTLWYCMGSVLLYKGIASPNQHHPSLPSTVLPSPRNPYSNPNPAIEVKTEIRIQVTEDEREAAWGYVVACSWA